MARFTASAFTRLARILAPDDDPALAATSALDYDRFVAAYRNRLGKPTAQSLELAERWLYHACYEYGLEDGDDVVLDCAHALWLAHVAADVSDVPALVRDSPDWAGAIRVALAERRAYGDAAFRRNDAMRTDHARQIQAGRAARHLREQGYPIELADGRLAVSPQTYAALLAEIERRVQVIGGTPFANGVVGAMRSFHRTEFDRYVVPRPTSNAPVERAPTYPLGYLLDLALKAVPQSIERIPDANEVQALLELTRDVIALHEVEPYSWQDFTAPDLPALLSMLARTLAYDRWFDRRQLRPAYVLDLLRGAFDGAWRGMAAIGECDFPFGLATFVRAVCVVIDLVGGELGGGAFGMFGLLDAFVEAGIERAEAAAVLAALMHEPETINRDFLDPCESVSNAFDKPLVRVGDFAYLADLRFFGEAAYRAAASAYVAAAAVPARTAHAAIGARFEEHVRERFRASGIPVSAYHYGKPSARVEIDGIIESREGIILVEVKKRELSLQARAGDVQAALKDMFASLLHSQNQAMRLEALLYAGDVRVPGFGKLRRGDRTIERLSIVPFSYGFLHYRSIRDDALRLIPQLAADQALMGFMGQGIAKLLAERERLLDELEPLQPGRRTAPDFCHHFLDYDQLRVLLARSTDPDAFYEQLTAGSNADFRTFDWYGERLAYDRLFGAQ